MLACWFREKLKVKKGPAWFVLGVLLMAPIASAQQPMSVLASIKPLQLIAQALTHGVEDTEVLLPPGVTPHDYALKPSDLKRVYAADVLLWLGPEIEPYLAKPMKLHEGAQLAAWQADVEAMDDHHHEHDHHGHDDHHLYGDPHIWFSPEQAERIAQELVSLLIRQAPQHAQQYQQNLDRFIDRLAKTDREIKAQLAIKPENYLVAHDAYSHFEQHYGLQHIGVISETPESKLGAKGLLTLRKRIVEEQIRCLFVEPQTDARIVSILVEGNALQVYSLDPMASDIELSALGYEAFLQDTARRFSQCH